MKIRLLSLLLCLALLAGVLPAGAFSLAAAAVDSDAAVTGAGLSADDPIIARTYDELKAAFDHTAASGAQVFVKLGRDISYSHYERGTLITQGNDLTLDLAGYTFTCRDSSNQSYTVIHGKDGAVTITDSKRYDTSSGWGKYVDGTIDYLYTLPDRDTSVLSGKIILKGGVIRNRTHSSDDKHTNSAYCSGKIGEGTYNATDYKANLTMEKGVLEADCPIVFGSSDIASSVSGGQLWVKGVAGIRQKTDSHNSGFPTITNVTMSNRSSNEKAIAFDIDLEDGFEDKYGAAEAMAVFKKMVSDEVFAYIDNTLQDKGKQGVVYNAVGGLIGPLFKSSYVLTPLERITQLDLTIDEPAIGDAMSYKARGSYLDGYDVSSYTAYNWNNGVQWTDGSVYTDEYPVGSTFAAGKSYTVFIKVNIAQKGFVFADESDMSATINGEKAMCYSSGENEYIVYHTFRLEATAVSKAAVTVTAPKAGESPSYSASVPTGRGYMIESGYTSGGIKNGVAWMHENGSAMADGEKFAAGQKYQVLVFVTLTDTQLYKFADYDNFSATVNNNAATALPYSSVRYGITYKFSLSGQVDSVEITIPSISVGQQMQWTASAPDGADYAVTNTSAYLTANGVTWYKDGKTVAPGKAVTFEEGVEYKVTIGINLNDSDKVFAPSESLKATVNGEEAVTTRPSDKKATVAYTFTATASVIDSVAVTVTAPVAGQKPVYSATIPEGMGYEIRINDSSFYKNGVGWFRTDGDTNYYLTAGNTFRAGDTYYVNVLLKPSDGYKFAKNVTGTLNGQPAQVKVTSSNDAWRHVVFTFPALEEAAAEIDTLEITAPQPMAGDELFYIASVPQGKGYAVEDFNSLIFRDGAAWRNASGYYIPIGENNTFAAGEKYIYVVSLVLTDSQKYKFADINNISATVNGNEAQVVRWDDSNYGVLYTFTVPQEAPPTEMPTEPEPPTEEPVWAPLLGDADGNGVVNVFDAAYVQKGLTGTKNYPAYGSMDKSETAYRVADVDGDGAVNIFDASLIQKFLTGTASAQKYGIGKPLK